MQNKEILEELFKQAKNRVLTLVSDYDIIIKVFRSEPNIIDRLKIAGVVPFHVDEST
jgi:hypothetical protein